MMKVELNDIFVDDMITFVENVRIVYILDKFKNFDEQIQFTYEVKHNNKLSFQWSYSNHKNQILLIK